MTEREENAKSKLKIAQENLGAVLEAIRAKFPHVENLKGDDGLPGEEYVAWQDMTALKKLIEKLARKKE